MKLICPFWIISKASMTSKHPFVNHILQVARVAVVYAIATIPTATTRLVETTIYQFAVIPISPINVICNCVKNTVAYSNFVNSLHYCLACEWCFSYFHVFILLYSIHNSSSNSRRTCILSRHFLYSSSCTLIWPLLQGSSWSIRLCKMQAKTYSLWLPCWLVSP